MSNKRKMQAKVRREVETHGNLMQQIMSTAALNVNPDGCMICADKPASLYRCRTRTVQLCDDCVSIRTNMFNERYTLIGS